MSTTEEKSAAEHPDSTASANEAESEYLKLRKLLLGPDYDAAIRHYINGEEDAARVADVLAEAVKVASHKDPALVKALAPILDQAISKSIDTNPRRITNVIFPIIGPSIRKAVSAALADMVRGLNSVLEQSLSFRGLTWRLKAWRAGVPYGQYVISRTLQYRVDQVLLVHRETGLLLNNVVNAGISEKDPEQVSSMLTAITDFVNDSFFEPDQNGHNTEAVLDKIQLGEFTLHLFSGPSVVLAAAVRGTLDDKAQDIFHTTIEEIHRDYRTALASFDGDRKPFTDTDEALKACLLSERRQQDEKTQRKPWLALLVIAALLTYAGAVSYHQYRISEQVRHVINQIKHTEGIVLLETSRQGTDLSVSLLRNAAAIPLSQLQQQLTDLAPELQLDLHATTLTFGAIDTDKLKMLKLPEPPPKPSLLSQYRKVTGNINSTAIYYHQKSIAPDETEMPKLQQLMTDIKSLNSLSRQLGYPDPQIMILGFADKNGTRYGNIKVSQERANHIRDILIQNKVGNTLVAWGLGDKSQRALDEVLQRRVSFYVTDRSRIPADSSPGASTIYASPETTSSNKELE